MNLKKLTVWVSQGDNDEYRDFKMESHSVRDRGILLHVVIKSEYKGGVYKSDQEVLALLTQDPQEVLDELVDGLLSQYKRPIPLSSLTAGDSGSYKGYNTTERKDG